MSKNKTVCILGPDILRPNAEELRLKAEVISGRYDLTPIIPDGTADKKTYSHSGQFSEEIYKKNIKSIEKSDFVIADISPFRGPSGEAATMFNIGYATAKGIKVFAHTSDSRDYKTRVGAPDGMLIEDFSNVENLMIAHSIATLSPSIEDAFKKAEEASKKGLTKGANQPDLHARLIADEVGVYVAGPDVFYPNAKELADNARELGVKYGLKSLIPIDNEIVGDFKTPTELSEEIYRKNVEMIDRAAITIANISPFRGPSADSGTVWEIGYSVGKNMVVFAFTDDMSEYKSRVSKDDTNIVENFKLTEVGIIANAVHSISPSIEEAFRKAQEYVQEIKLKEANKSTNKNKPSI